MNPPLDFYPHGKQFVFACNQWRFKKSAKNHALNINTIETAYLNIYAPSSILIADWE